MPDIESRGAYIKSGFDPIRESKMANQKTKKNTAIHLMAGGVAGACEALACHPLDTIKVRLQLRGSDVVKVSPLLPSLY